jgi:pyrroloquinoline-quinone synthase
MHEGRLGREDLARWVTNRYYYQTRIPIKDALLLAKSEDCEFRRVWIQRIRDHDGDAQREGGLAGWWRLADAVGIPRASLLAHAEVLPGVRFACDAYVGLVRESSLVEGVASSLTEWFAPSLMRARVAALAEHYPWLPGDALDYFRERVPRAERDAVHALELVRREARTAELQQRCLQALVRKTEILWHLLDCVAAPRQP